MKNINDFYPHVPLIRRCICGELIEDYTGNVLASCSADCDGNNKRPTGLVIELCKKHDIKGIKTYNEIKCRYCDNIQKEYSNYCPDCGGDILEGYICVQIGKEVFKRQFN